VTVAVAVALLVGLMLGVVVCRRLLRRRTPARAAALFERWREAEEAGIREDAGRRSEAVLRGTISEQLAPSLASFPFAPADARFLGAPVDFVVFDGLTEVDSGRASRLRSIIFVEVKTGAACLTTVQRRIKDCLEEGRVSCLELEARR
jgi:predicted Holliday junction resolvase-like endonuclease